MTLWPWTWKRRMLEAEARVKELEKEIEIWRDRAYRQRDRVLALEDARGEKP